MQIILEEAPGTQEVASASNVDSYPAITADFVSELLLLYHIITITLNFDYHLPTN